MPEVTQGAGMIQVDHLPHVLLALFSFSFSPCKFPPRGAASSRIVDVRAGSGGTTIWGSLGAEGEKQKPECTYRTVKRGYREEMLEGRPRSKVVPGGLRCKRIEKDAEAIFQQQCKVPVVQGQHGR